MNLSDVVSRIQSVPLRDGRRIIGIVGAPASGKSTLATALAAEISNASVVPMDGFHRSNDDLESHGLLSRKGAPETFDASGFVHLVQMLRLKSDIPYPTFDRKTDSVVPNSGRLPATAETVLVEGNYLLLNSAPWSALAKEWDLSIVLDVPLPVLRDRLVQRWLDNGYDADGALKRAQHNDIPNAEVVVRDSFDADLVVRDLTL